VTHDQQKHRSVQGRVLAEAVDGIAVSLFAITLPALQRREGWVRLGTDDPDRRRERYAEPVGR
jgi:hypothetical protein